MKRALVFCLLVSLVAGFGVGFLAGHLAWCTPPYHCDPAPAMILYPWTVRIIASAVAAPFVLAAVWRAW